jgi:hypothetical protein
VFFWYQRTGGEDQWVEAIASHRARIIEEVKPAFVTVLDAYSSPDDSWTRDDYAKMKYSGPLYFDWDAEDVSETIPKFQQFLTKLQDLGVNLNSVRLYATGGRGFHCEVPEPIFMPKAMKGGVAQLPYIYREMAMDLVVDTMDMRVYTGRRGRMWRVPNVQRSNGKYKVPITVDEAFTMTPEEYNRICSEPRAEIQRELPELCPQLAATFIKAQGRLEEAVKRRAKAGKDEELLARYKGEFPPTIKRIMAGEGLAPGVGFQKISMQLAIAANALGKTADELVEASEGLVKNHQSDGSRYNSPRKRKEELRRMWDYTHDNPCYVYSRGAIRSLCDVDVPTSDLDGVSESVGIGHVPDSDDENDNLPSEVEAEVSAAQNSLLEGMMITNSGIYKRTADGAKSLSNMAFRKPSVLIEADEGLVVGFECDIRADNEAKGRHMVALKNFTSRSALSNYCAGFGAVFSGSDTQAGVIQVMLSRSAKKGGRVLYIVRKEGLDVIQNPEIRDRVSKDVIWSAPDSVLTHNEAMAGKYKFQPIVSTQPVFNTDIHNCQPIENTEDTRRWLHALLDINHPVTVAQMLGWFVSCFHRQFYHASFDQFPLLHPNGPAGCGKTLTTTLLGRMFHNTTQPIIRGCSPGSSTNFSLKAAWAGSASVPLLLDEYKPAEMGPMRTEFLLQHFRMLYNQGAGASGGMSKGAAESSFRDVTDYTFSAPTAFLAESQEMQTAIVQRSIPVSFNPDFARQHTDSFNLAKAGSDFMPQLGSLLLRFSMMETVESRAASIRPLVDTLRAEYVDVHVHDRQVYNLAVILEGLNFLDMALTSVFDSEFKADLDRLKGELYGARLEVNVAAMSEAAKLMNDLSLMSRTEDPESPYAMREGIEYAVINNELHLLMRETYVKYSSWCKAKGFTPLYSSADAFMSAMGKFPPIVDKLGMQSPLKKSGQSRVFRFAIQKMTTEGVEPFRNKDEAWQ